MTIKVLINTAHAFQCADVEGVLRAEIAGVRRVDLAAGNVIIALFLQGHDLGLSQHRASLGDVRFQCDEPLLEVGQVVAQPDRPHTGGAHKAAALAQLIAHAHLAVRRLLQSIGQHGLLNCFVDPILEIRASSVLVL